MSTEDSRLSRLLKSKPFPVVDLINWTDKEKDEAVIAYLQGMGMQGFAMAYAESFFVDKNDCYAVFESTIQDLIDKFNECNL